jgi:tetratricopeptide (TPR) repeat protein
MSKISLRDYNQKIESLLDIGNNNEAIFHALAILNVYPKYTDTYRNLGKALLEEKRGQEANDVFSKVLSVFPDDFISHVGLSSIKENDHDLDAAIWHMEQAFDTQPSNVVVQEELRRLLGRRDGAAPNKIRLSRGALVRMYLKGELYQQAISEIHSYQKNNPPRIDLDVILAKIYLLTGRFDEAVEISSKIVEQYPYCFEANKILAEHGETVDRNTYRSRLIDIDPYMQFVNEQYPTSDEVPSDSIILEEESYVPPENDQSEIPDWARQIGLNWSTEDSNDIKSNNSFEDTSESVSPFIGEEAPPIPMDVSQEPETTSKDTLPDWMKNAGWTKEADSESPSIDENSAGENESESLEQIFSQDENNAADSLPSWMSEFEDENVEPDRNPEPANTEDAFPSSDEPVKSMDGWSTEISDEQGLASEQYEDTSAGFETSENEIARADLPDWLKNYDLEDANIPLAPQEEEQQEAIDSSVDNLEQQTVSEIKESSSSPLNLPEASDIEDFSPNLQSVDLSSNEDDLTKNIEPEEKVPDWVSKILGGGSVTSALNENEDLLETEKPFEHLDGSSNGNPGQEQEVYLNEKSLPVEDADVDIPEFITELSTEADAEGIISDDTNEELMSWFNTVASDEISAEDKIEEVHEPSREEEVPEISVDTLIDQESLMGDQEENHQSDEGLPIEEIESPELDDRLSGLVGDFSETVESEVTPQLDENQIPTELNQATEGIPEELISEPGSSLLDEYLSEEDVKEISPAVDDSISVTPDRLEDQEKDLGELNILEELDSQNGMTFEELVQTPDLSFELDEGVSNTSMIESLLTDLENEPSSFEKWRSLGDEYFKEGKLDKALDAYLKAERNLIKSSQE